MASTAPKPAFNTPPVDSEFYSAIVTKAQHLKNDHVVPPRSGYAFVVPAGHVFRLSLPEGPQVGGLNLWNLHNPRERFWASRTRQLQASHVSVGDRLWSCLPHLGPMVTIVADSLRDYGVDKFGGRCHDLLGTRCDPYVNKLLSGNDYDYQCHSNLTRAIVPYGLIEYDVHDVLNVFQVTGLDKDGKYFMEASPAKAGDHIEFFAEMDLLCALSTCPGGDLSAWGWGEGSGEDMRTVCRPMKVEVFEVEMMDVWKPEEKPRYTGVHGMKIPTGEATDSTGGG